MQLKNKVIIITGSSIGIGRTMARTLSAQGAKIVLNARNAARLNKTFEQLKSEGIDCIAVAGDVSKMEDCEKMVAQAVAAYGGVDVLVNNAGISMEGSVENLDPEVFRKVMEVNYLGSVFPTKAALSEIKKTKGSIVFIGSVAAFRGIPDYSVYSSSKNALTSLAEALKIELSDAGVHVGIAYVGFTENDPEKTIFNADGKIIAQPKRDFIKAESPEKVAQRVAKMIANRRFKHVFTPLGKLNAIMTRFLPGIVGFVLSNNYKKKKG